MNELKRNILKFLTEKEGFKDFDGEILPNGDRALAELAKDLGVELQSLCEPSESLQSKGLIKITHYGPGEIGSSNKKIALRVELTQDGINFIQNLD